MIDAIAVPPTLTDQFMLESLREHLDRYNPSLVCLTVPFPGNLYGAFRIAHSIKSQRPGITIALGGGYANTELRRLSDPAYSTTSITSLSTTGNGRCFH